MTTRFRPTRAGVINVWDYVDEEFAFADGRLALRGHNGSGKTKALEVLFPFVLDGVADSRRLDPFSGENRTMKSNLLFRGQDSEYGYVWMEFARTPAGPAAAPAGPAAPDDLAAPAGPAHPSPDNSKKDVETVTLVIGMRANRSRDGVKMSFYVTGRRLGVDFGLLSADSRPLTERQLREVLEPQAYRRTATEYRDLVDARLFGLGRERYAQLLDLLLALRRPLLAKDLDPGKVSDTLTAGLSPVDDALVQQAARDFENLAAVQALFDDLTRAHAAVQGFHGHYATYLRSHARFQLDKVQQKIDLGAAHAAAIGAAAAAHKRALAAEREAERGREARRAEGEQLQGRLDGLRNSEEYKAQGRIEDKRREVVARAREVASQRDRLARDNKKIRQAQEAARKLERRVADARAAASRHAADLADAGTRSGIADDGFGPVDAGDELLATARARVAARRDDVGEIRRLLQAIRDAQSRREYADAELGRKQQAQQEQEASSKKVAERLATARERAAAELAAWTARWAPPVPAAPAPSPARAWVDILIPPPASQPSRASQPALASKPASSQAVPPPSDGAGQLPGHVIAQQDATVLAEALEAIGEPGATGLPEVYAQLTGERQRAVITAKANLETELRAHRARLADLVAERDAIAAEKDDAPPASDLRPASRDGRPGAPLWQLVRFADGITGDRAAAIEGALYGAGLLTAWVHPDPALTQRALAAAEADGYLVAAEAVPGRSLAHVLIPEQQDQVPVGVIDAVLHSVGLTEDVPGTAGAVVLVSEKGHFAAGPHVGARPKAAPEFIGATNRASRRQARLAAQDALIAGAHEREQDLAARLAAVTSLLDDFAAARRELPGTRPIAAAAEAVGRHAALLARARDDLVAGRKALDGAIAELDARTRQLRQAATERRVPVFSHRTDGGSPAGGQLMATAHERVDSIARAAAEFENAAVALHNERSSLAQAQEDLAEQAEVIERQRSEYAEAESVLDQAQRLQEALEEEFRALEEALASDVQRVLEEIRAAELGIAAARRGYDDLDRVARGEHDQAVTAAGTLRGERQSLAEAVAAVHEQAAGFAELARPDLRSIIGLPGGDLPHWPDAAQWPDPRRASEELAAMLEAGAGEPDIRAVLPAGVPEVLDAYGAATKGGRQVTEGVVKNASDRMSTGLKDFEQALEACEGDYRVDWEPGAVVVVSVIDDEGRKPVGAFADRIRERAQDQGVLLEDRERKVLEDELLAGLAHQIHGRVLAARDLTRDMDADTRSKPMSSGITIGIRWAQSDRSDNMVPNYAEARRAVSRLLERDQPGPERLAELRGLIRDMVRGYRAAHPRATYREALAAALDYRSWHAFELLMKTPGEPEARLTRAKHSVMSGGEKSASIHLPLFAAANALYSSAKPDCPRMIALDEAFAGIDERYKPDLFGLTVKFDLDLFMTGHDLWVTCDTVPMIAHYDMYHDKTTRTVSSLLVLWDGTALVDASASFADNEALATELLGFRSTRHAPLGTAATLYTQPAGPDPSDDEDEDD
ncbi:MAG TPA: SbcC/MukB-like Walker B domain-containing protein [Trebonia sp.]|nr:SbcC/MukB-like Walker B domain-containing protein [Trebonia sp.]